MPRAVSAKLELLMEGMSAATKPVLPEDRLPADWSST
jgi:DNA-binding transcriptional regulator PaaX